MVVTILPRSVIAHPCARSSSASSASHCLALRSQSQKTEHRLNVNLWKGMNVGKLMMVKKFQMRNEMLLEAMFLEFKGMYLDSIGAAP